jgi:hypothetical protein
MIREPEEARLAARLECLLYQAERTRDLTALSALHAEVLGDGDRSPVYRRLALSVECAIEVLRSEARPVADSVPIWDALRAQAETVMEPDDAVLMSIRSFQAQYTRRRGRPEDLDAGCRMYEEELALRRRYLGEDDYRTRITRANWALALRDRGEEGDVSQAVRILEEEMEHRLNHYGGAHPFTWEVQTVLAQTTLRAGTSSGDPSVRRHRAAGALDLIRPVATHRLKRFGWTDAATLRAQLVEANVLLELGEAGEAVAEIRHVRTAADVAGAPLDSGWPEFLLATGMAALGDRTASAMAERSLRLRHHRYLPDSRPVAESRALVAELRRRFAE